ncbi:hypothetical protein FC682_19915 [Peribacillus simplex]|uniref:Uncharacterized protein n=1 Tax=Peribacillus simplex TaxID=1478 RepID=A0A9X8ZDP3_9BACI|nr:hypothetical protein [Peribacillus simplex]TKH02956.1 hypothetical protein FC682_19915 [Peribacillus simplex]TKH07780.1 hypothetical protein FC678_22230 [Peribacillus simplex]
MKLLWAKMHRKYSNFYFNRSDPDEVTRIFFIAVFLFTYLHLQTYSYATETNISEKSRVLLNVKDTKGISYDVHFFAPKETKTDYYLCSTGDEVFIGNYSFLIQKQGENDIKTTSIILKDYPYNQTQRTRVSDNI